MGYRGIPNIKVGGGLGGDGSTGELFAIAHLFIGNGEEEEDGGDVFDAIMPVESARELAFAILEAAAKAEADLGVALYLRDAGMADDEIADQIGAYAKKRGDSVTSDPQDARARLRNFFGNVDEGNLGGDVEPEGENRDPED